EPGGNDCRGHLERAARVAPHALGGERQEAERGDRRQQRAKREEEPVTRRAPRERDPDACDCRVDEREARRDVPEREHRYRQRKRETEARSQQRQQEGEYAQERRKAERKERQCRGRPAREHTGGRGSREARKGHARERRNLGAAALLAPAKALCEGLAQLVRERRGARSSGGIERKHSVDERRERLRQVGADVRERRRARLDLARGLEERAVPERMP